jgi:hypothetical protein
MQVAKKTTTKEVWDCLKARFIGADHLRDARMQSLKSDFDALHMQEGETPDQYAGKLAGISVRHSSLGGTLNDATLVKKLFNTVPDRFLNFAGVNTAIGCILSEAILREVHLKHYQHRFISSYPF